MAARSSARTSFSEPLTARPIGVRTASTMTASGMGSVLSVRSLGEALAQQLRVGGDVAGVVGEVRRLERLRAVAQRVLGILADLDDDAVRADRGGGSAERLDEAAVAGGVARVDDHRKVGVELQPRHRAEIEREARRGLERADAALAEDDVLVALLQDVVGGLEELVERAAEAALEEDRLAELAGDLEERVVLHVARADLDDVGVGVDGVGVLAVEQLGDDREAGLGAGLGEDLEGRAAQALERERARAGLEGAAAEHGGARLLDGPRDAE